MNILVTGAKGFIGKNLVAELNNQKKYVVFEYDQDTDMKQLDFFCSKADFVFHLAGVNRPENQDDFMKGNYGLTSVLLDLLKRHQNTSPVMISSSIQAELDNPYGKSKKAGENLMFCYGRDTGARVLVYRFPNVFGKWCKPNYNSVVATFCSNIANNLPITINNPLHLLELVYIDDVVQELIKAIDGHENRVSEFCYVPVIHKATLGEIADLLYSFKESRNNLCVPNVGDFFVKKLYSTYLSYLPQDSFGYSLKMNKDHRGSFTEFLKIPERGQVSVNISKAGIIKGNHWHHTKNEKFLVVHGSGVIRFRKIDSNDTIEYYVSGNELKVIDIPVGYTHNIENLGSEDMVTIMWANESFDPARPDTYYLEV